MQTNYVKNNFRRVAVVAATATLAAATAAADLEVVVPNNAAVTTAFADGAEVHTYDATIPQGAKLTVNLKSAKGGPLLHALLFDPAAVQIGDAQGAKPSFKNVVADASGDYTMTVASTNGASTAGYGFTLAWKSAKPAARTVVVGAGAVGDYGFSADDGATAKISVKKGRSSAAAPTLVSLDGPDGSSTPLGPGASQSVVLSGSGDYVVHFDGGAAGGAVAVAVTLKPPKFPKTTLAIAAGSVARDVRVFATKTIGPTGGALDLAAGPLTGSAVQIPAGALPAPVSLVVGTSPNLAGAQPGDVTGPAVFVGPEGLSFVTGKTASVTIPYDPSAFPDGVASLKVYTRDAAGNVALVAGAVVDQAAHTVTFPASHFSAFQVLRDFHFVETQRLDDAANATDIDEFGNSVAVDGDVAAVAAHRRGTGTLSSPDGVVVAYHRSGTTWTAEATLLPSNFGPVDQFGEFVSVSGNRFLAGAPGHLNPSGIRTGSAFVFLRDSTGGWAQEADLVPPTGAVGAFLGSGGAIDGDTAFVAAAHDSDVLFQGGAVHVFARDVSSGAWNFVQTLRPSSSTAGQAFGQSVGLSGDTAVVGAPSDVAPDFHGAVYVYRRAGGTWTQAARLVPPGASDSAFGTSVAINGTTIVVGLQPLPTSGQSTGGVRIYEDDGATFPEVARFGPADVLAPGESAHGVLGASVAVHGDLVLATAPNQDIVFPGATSPVQNANGNAYVFHRAGGAWRYSARIRGTPNDAIPIADGDLFGISVALDGQSAFFGHYSDTIAPGISVSGAALVFDVSGN